MRLLELEKSGQGALPAVADFIQENPEAHSALIMQQLEFSAGGDALEGQFAYDRLTALSSLSSWLGGDTELMQAVFKLEREGLSLTALADLLNEDQIKQAHVQTLIAQGAPLEQVVKAMSNFSQSFAHLLQPADAEYMGQLLNNGLGERQLRAFVADQPAARLGLVEELIRQKVTAQRFRDQMSLSMLPDDIASKLLEISSVPVSQILGPMRNWQSGAYFRDLLIEQVASGQALSASKLAGLSARAKELALTKAGDGQSDLNRAGESDSHAPSSKTSFPITNPRAIEAANIINEAIEEILKEIPENKTIVVLGRDALPLFPALKNRGRDAQYFLWSRLQGSDSATREQWLREVGQEPW